MNNQLLDNYDINFRVEDKEFKLNNFCNLFFQDINYFNINYLNVFEQTKSFKYFNYFHISFNNSNNIYLIKNGLIQDKNNYNNLFLVDSKKKNYFIKLYKASRNKNIYNINSFFPNNNLEDFNNNIFKGYSYELNNYDENTIKYFLDFVYFICNESHINNKVKSNYLLNYISRILQYPYQRSNKCIILYDKSDKYYNVDFNDIIIKLFTNYCGVFRNIKELNSKYNENIFLKILMVSNYININVNKECNKLKNIIKRDEDIIKMKHNKEFIGVNYKNFIIYTDNEDIINLDNLDNTFVMINIETDEEYNFKKVNFIKDIIEDNNKINDLFNYFMNRDIRNFSFENTP